MGMPNDQDLSGYAETLLRVDGDPAQPDGLYFAAANVAIPAPLQQEIDQQKARIITDLESRSLTKKPEPRARVPQRSPTSCKPRRSSETLKLSATVSAVSYLPGRTKFKGVGIA
ncbi:hypothetical protein [Propionivibrio sp.]|uniref:hypothetical protein n=1 Tax=Propionivibrio sp. TaxID=2212460 RepID=UPI0026326093|nr:hypothetical protein [Propionivibrio sp.]